MEVKLTIKGRVQGVFFRQSTQREAQKLGVKGYVKNLDDGSVEVVATGSEEAVSKLIGFCRHGPEHADVTDVSVETIDDVEFKHFSVKF